MLSQEQLIELYGGLPLEKIVPARGSGWWIETPSIKVEGSREHTVLIQGGIYSEYAQLSHKVRRFVQGGFPVICLSQAGAATVDKTDNFYHGGGYWRFVERDVAVLDTFGVGKVIAYGSSIGATASIALAAEHPKRVAAVIAVNPASLFSQKPWKLVRNFLLSTFQHVDKDFEPPPTSRISLREALGELKAGVAKLAASDIGVSYLEKVRCPVFIYTGNEDGVFPTRKLKALEQLPNVRVLPMVGFVHSDPNSREKMDRLVSNASRELQELGVI